MKRFENRRAKLATGVVGLLVLAGAGGALAATELDTPSARDSAIISDAAGQLGIQPSALSSALTKAITNELNAEVSAGQLTQAQASALEARLASGQLPLFGGELGGFGRALGGGLGAGVSAAASYLGLTAAQIESKLQGGETLAQVASGAGKTSDGLIQALLSAEEAKLASAVSAGTLTSAQETAIESNLQQQITALVNGKRPAGPSFGGGFGLRPRGGPGGFAGGFGGGAGFGFGLGPFAGGLSAAASYLGLTAAQIESKLQGGETLAQVASGAGKTSDGLIQALLSAEEAKLASAVSAGTLTSAQETAIESNLQQQITALVNGTRPAGPRFGMGSAGGFAPGFGFRRSGGARFGGPGAGSFGAPGGGSGTSSAGTATA